MDNPYIKCEKCNSTDVIISVQYCKSTVCRILKFICLIAILITAVLNMAAIIQYDEIGKNLQAQDTTITIQAIANTYTSKPAGVVPTNPTGIIILFLAIAAIIIDSIQQWIESKPRVYYYCKTCGEIWFTDDIWKKYEHYDSF